MNKILQLTSALVFLFSNIAGAAAIVSSAKVLYVGTYGNGTLFVGLDKQIAEPGCSFSRFDVAAGNDQIKAWLSIAMAASISGKLITVRTNGCLGPFPTLDNTGNTYFHIETP